MTIRSQDSVDHQRYRVVPLGEDGVDLGAGKRKLPSPDGSVRQTALPQPLTGRERSREEEEVEQQQLSRERGEETVQSSESYIFQERQEQTGYLREEEPYTGGQTNRAITGGKIREGNLLTLHCNVLIFSLVYSIISITITFYLFF